MLCLWGVVPACDHFVAGSWWPWWCLLTIRWRCGNCGASMAHVSGVEGMVPSSPSVVPSSRAQCAITAGHPPECLYHPTQRLISSHPVSTHPDSSTATWSPPHSQDQQFRCDQCDYILAWEGESAPIHTIQAHNCRSSPPTAVPELSKQKSSELESGLPKPTGLPTVVGLYSVGSPGRLSTFEIIFRCLSTFH